MQAIVVAGLPHSGKTTAIELLKKTYPTLHFLEAQSIVEIAEKYLDTSIIVIRSPIFFCFKNALKAQQIPTNTSFESYYEQIIKRQETYFPYVLEIPNTIILQNDRDLAHLRLQISKLKL